MPITITIGTFVFSILVSMLSGLIISHSLTKVRQNILIHDLQKLTETDKRQELLEEWYRRNVAKYNGARMSSEELYGRPGLHFTLRGFMIARDLPKDFINRAIMEKFLINKKHPINYKKGYLEFEGICCVIWGDVSTGNYGT